METKVCSKCGKGVSADKFCKDKRRHDGLASECKECHNKHYQQNKVYIGECGKKYRQENKAAIEEYQKQYRQKNKSDIAERGKRYYLVNKKYITGRNQRYHQEHKVSTAKYNKQWRQDNVEILAGKRKQWQQDNKEIIAKKQKLYHSEHLVEHRIRDQKREAKKRSLPATLTIEQWERIKLHFNNRCCYCGEEKPLAQEHFISLTSYGSYDINNIVSACKECNSSKYNKSFFSWYPSHESYDDKRKDKILKYLNYDKQNNQQLSIL